MPEPTTDALRAHERRIAGMLADPECVGELLLVGMAMARSVDLDDPPWGVRMSLAPIAWSVYGRFWQSPSMLVPDRTAHGHHHPCKRLLDVFRYDRRRYEPADSDNPWATFCERPMLRRSGVCGGSGSSGAWLIDPANGLRSYVGACSQPSCRRWIARMVERNAAELAAHPAPVPPANRGGVLERHLPEIDWWKVWRGVAKDWTPPPEGRAFERPTLTLHVADDEPEALPTPPVRPVLRVLEGGWR